MMSDIKITITEKKEESALSIVMACIVSVINMFLGAWVFSVPARLPKADTILVDGYSSYCRASTATR